MTTIEDICALVGEHLRRSRIAPDDALRADLGAESPEIAALVAALEDRYGLTIEEEELPELRTVDDLYRRVLREPRDGRS